MIGAILAMQLSSATFTPNSTVPASMAATQCGGENRSPELHWSGVPSRTKSLALVVHDPDAPVKGGFTHWVIYDLAPSTTEIPAQAAIAPANSGKNDTGSVGYFGPCPPPGKPHHYVFTLFALDAASLGAKEPLGYGQLLARIAGHVVAQTTLTGLFATSPR